MGNEHRPSGCDGARPRPRYNRDSVGRPMSTRSRQGFALVAILWVLTVASVLGAGAALQGRDAYSAARNRLNAQRAYWIAEGCAAEALASADRILASST